MSTILPVVGPQRDDTGFLIVITLRRPNGTRIDLTAVTGYVMIVRTPTGRTLKWIPTLYALPTDGQIQYRPLAGDVREPGLYRAQVYVTVSGTRKWSTQPFAFPVGENL